MTSPSSDEPPSILQGILFGALGLLALLPMVAIICKAPIVRAWLSRVGCTSCVACCERFFPSDADADRLERAAVENSIPAYYRLMFGPPRRGRENALHLVSWRDDLRHHAFHNEHTIKLQQIQLKSNPIPSYVPPDAMAVGLVALQQNPNDASIRDDEEEEQKVEEA